MPNTPQQLLQQALTHHRAGELRQAEAIYRQILSANPQHYEAMHLLGVLAHQAGNNQVAMELIRAAINLKPDAASYHHNLAEVSRAAGHLPEAEQACRRAIALAPQMASAHNNLAVILREQGKLDEAIAISRKAIELDPNSVSGLLNLANALGDRNHFDEAIDCYHRAIALNPNHSQVLTNLGSTLSEMGRFDDAIAAFGRAIENDDYPDAHWNRSLMWLLRGNFAPGWDEFEWRWQSTRFNTPRLASPKPQWDGADPSGKTILLYTEQGFGDAIQFIRYAPLVADHGARVIVATGGELKSILSRVRGIDRILTWDEPLPEYDLHLPLMSLPRIFKTDLTNIPTGIPYIHPDPIKVEQWRAKLGDAPGKKIGLAWAGRPTHPYDRNRSIRLEQIAELSSVPGIRWISLQKGPARSQIRDSKFQMHDFTEDLHDFSDTAALIANLDLIISVDTAVVHLAGAMGKPAWVLHAFVPDWRWLLDRQDSPWYPTIQLFRQNRHGEWGPVLRNMIEKLKDENV